MDIQEQLLISKKELYNIYKSFCSFKDKKFDIHIKRFWCDNNMYMNPYYYEQDGLKLSIFTVKNGCLGIQLKKDNFKFPIITKCTTCEGHRKFFSFQKLMCGNHLLCKKCLAKQVQNRNSVRDKQKETNNKKYGGNAPICSDVIKKKIKDTMMSKLGVSYAAQSYIVREKYKNTCLKNWGVKNYLASKECMKKARTSSGCISKFSDYVYNKLILLTDTFIEREKQFIVNDSCYYTDFYLPDKKIVIECYGQYWHADSRIYHENDIIKYPGNRIITAKEMWQKDNKRENDLLSIIDKVVKVKILYEYDFINDNLFNKKIEDILND